MARALATHLADVGKIELTAAKKRIDADYVRGILVFKEDGLVIETDVENLSVTRGPRPLAVRLIQGDYESGDYGVLDAARSSVEFKDFLWGDLMVEANMEAKMPTKW